MKKMDIERNFTDETLIISPQQNQDELTREMFPPETNQQTEITPAHLSGEISSAKCVIKEWSDDLVDAVAGTRKTREAALAAIYKAYWPMSTNGRLRRDFYSDNKINQHGNTQNPATPFVGFLLRDADKMCRSQVTKFAGAIGWALKHSVEPDQFTNFIEKENGYTEAYNKYADVLDSNGDRKDARKLEVQQKIAEFTAGTPSREYDAPRLLKEHEGPIIALLDKPEPDKFHISTILYSDQNEVDKFIRQAANAAQKRGQNNGR